MAITYCNLNTDLSDAYYDWTKYQALETLTGWELSSGSVYKIVQSGYVEIVFEDGAKMTAGSTTSPSAGQFYYDSTTNILYITATGSVHPTTKLYQSGFDIATRLARARNEAQEELEGLLKHIYAIPFQKVVAPNTSYTSRDYDYYIRRMCANLTLSNFIHALNPDDPVSMRLRRWVDHPNPEPGEHPGVVQRIAEGEISLRTQRTARERGGFNVFEGASNGSTAYLIITGVFTGSQHETWRLVIDTLGAPGTATYKLSHDQGGTYDKTKEETRTANSDDRRVHLGSGIYAEFVGTFAVDDQWDIDLYPHTDSQEVMTVGSVKLRR